MDLGLSQRKLAGFLGVNKASVQHWEGNTVEPARWMVPRIREFHGQRPPEPPTSFGDRLTAYRRGRGLSQEALAGMLGVHKTTVVRWEMGRRRPSKAAEQKLASHLKLRP